MSIVPSQALQVVVGVVVGVITMLDEFTTLIVAV